MATFKKDETLAGLSEHDQNTLQHLRVLGGDDASMLTAAGLAKLEMLEAKLAASLIIADRANGCTKTLDGANTAGELAYIEDVRRKPLHHDGTPRPTFGSLSGPIQQSWERNPTPRNW